MSRRRSRRHNYEQHETSLEETSNSNEAIENKNNIDDEVEKDIIDELEREEDAKEERLSRTQTVNNLVSEVKMLTDDEDFMPEKKGYVKVLAILFILIVIGTVAVLFFMNKEEDKKESTESTSENTNHSYSYKEERDKLIFLDNGKEVDHYSCKKKCSAYELGTYKYHNPDTQVIAIQDGEDIFLYSYEKKKKITSNFTELQNLLEDGKTVAFIAYKDDKAGVISTEGKTVIPFDYDALGYAFGGGEVTDYSYENDYITASIDGKWGIITLDGVDLVVPMEYDDIFYNGYDCFIGKIDDSWYVMDLEDEKILRKGFDMAYPIKSYIFTSRKGEFQIYNYKGDKKLKEEVPTYYSDFRSREESVTPAFKITEDGTVITITIPKENDENETYKFNTVNGEFTNVLQ